MASFENKTTAKHNNVNGVLSSGHGMLSFHAFKNRKTHWISDRNGFMFFLFLDVKMQRRRLDSHLNKYRNIKSF